MAPFVIMVIFNIIMFGMVVSALMNAQNSLYKTFQRLSNLSRGNSVRQQPVVLDANRHRQLTDGRKQLQGTIGLLVLIGTSLIFNIFLVQSEKTENAIAYIFIIFNASQGNKICSGKLSYKYLKMAFEANEFRAQSENESNYFRFFYFHFSCMLERRRFTANNPWTKTKKIGLLLNPEFASHCDKVDFK